MNKKLYRLVFSKKKGTLVAVAETTVSQGKSAGETAGVRAADSAQEPAEYGLEGMRGAGGASFATVAFAVAMAFTGAAKLSSRSYAQSVLPTGGSITTGAGSIATNGNTMTVTQGSNVLGANLQSFSIGAGNSVVFNQPSAASVAINRVVGNNQSQIYGSLQANGQVFLINPNGVMFGQGAQVQVGALVATTKSITDAQIGAGNFTFTGSSTAGIINQGQIKATGSGGTGGYIVLHADSVSNDGTLTANGGTIMLAAGQTLGLSLDNGQLLSVQVTNAVANALVENKGLIVADGGAVYLTARGKETLLNNVVNNEGIIRARSMSSKNGVIVLDGGDSGAVVSSGTIDVSGRGGEKGGTAVMTGQYVALLNNATIDASGDAGGGAVIIGGDNLKKVTDIANVSMADQTIVQAGSTINISSKNGNGGFVETSGHMVNIDGNIDGASPKGKAGQWLIDPSNITITNSANVSVSNTGNIWNGTAATSTVNSTALTQALNTTDVTVTTNTGASFGTTTGNIIVSGNIIKTCTTITNLTLIAQLPLVAISRQQVALWA